EKPQLKNRNNFQTLVDPVLHGDYPESGLSEALAVTELCLQEQHKSRPSIGTVVFALSSLVSQSLDPIIQKQVGLEGIAM
ncbi:kinase superfamily protein, partial [Thalictrum thalictroides]